MIASFLSFIFLATQVGADSPLPVGARGLAISPSNQVAFSANGDLWVANLVTISAGHVSLATPKRVTAGDAWDLDPAWDATGVALIYSSNRNGSFDLWKTTLSPEGAAPPKRITSSAVPEFEPTVGPDGAIAFVRGEGVDADLWILDHEGGERRLTEAAGGERSPSFSPTGHEIAYVKITNGRHSLRRIRLEDDEDVLVPTEKSVEYPAWSPDGALIAFATRGGQPGVWITPPGGEYVNLVADVAAEIAWTNDGEHLGLAELPRSDPSYNGDPDRLRGFTVREVEFNAGRLWWIETPTPVSSPLPAEWESPISVTVSQTQRNAVAFDRLWNRLAHLYYQDAGRERWDAVRDEYRPSVVEAPTDSAREQIMYQMLRTRPPIRAERVGRAAVSSAHPLATGAGIEILNLEGNVVDAAIAVSFALGVVEPDASGVGGYGEMVLHLEGMAKPVVIEFLTRVPEHAALTNAALLQSGRLPADGPVLANVPGTVAGMYLAWERYGSGNVEWARLLEPAIHLAENGFVLDDAFTTTLRRERERYRKYSGSVDLFFRDDQPLAAGDSLRNPDLAWTLREIADGGADAFYRGEIAERLVRDLRGFGSAITEQDMARYFAVERPPVEGQYRGHTVYSGAPPVSGGASLVSKLHLLERVTETGLYTDHVQTAHAMIEAWKLAPSTRGLIADPGLWPVDLDPFINRDSAAARWNNCFESTRSTTPSDLRRLDDRRLSCNEDTAAFSWGEDGALCDSCRATGTTAFTVADGQGNIVSVTQTLGTWGGNFYVTPGLGFLYNDKLRSYSSDPSRYNARIPFARNSTSIAPTLVFKGVGAEQRPFLAVGAAGNAWITAAVYQVISGIIDGGVSPQRALELPRFLVGVRRSPTDRNEVSEIVVQMEDGFDPLVVAELTRMGHTLQPISLRGELRMGYGAAIVIEEGRVRAGADPRRSGHAAAIP